MKKAILLLSFLALCLFVHAKINLKRIETQILERSNFQRESIGLNPLLPEKSLADIARQHSKNMLEQGFFAHVDSDGNRVSDRVNRLYPELLYIAVAENLFSIENATDEETILDEAIGGWLKSPGHRENILNGKYSHLGVGAVQKGKKIMITQVFALPLVKLGTRIPDKVDQSKELVLFFEFMRPVKADKYQAFLSFPDPNIRHDIDDSTYVLGFEPFELRWINSKIFSVRLRFNAGKGNYTLSFGDGSSFLERGYTIPVY